MRRRMFHIYFIVVVFLFYITTFVEGHINSGNKEYIKMN